MTIALSVIDKEAIDSRAEVTKIDKDSLKHVETEDFQRQVFPPAKETLLLLYAFLRLRLARPCVCLR